MGLIVFRSVMEGISDDGDNDSAVIMVSVTIGRFLCTVLEC